MVAVEIKEHDVFVKSSDITPDLTITQTKMRRVVAVIDGNVCYSNGSDKNRFCKLSTFSRFAKKAKKVHEAESNSDRP